MIVALVEIVDTLVGALGVSTGVTVGAIAGVESPTVFVATTEKVYVCPDVRPVTTQIVGTTPSTAVTEQVKPPGLDVTV